MTVLTFHDKWHSANDFYMTHDFYITNDNQWTSI